MGRGRRKNETFRIRIGERRLIAAGIEKCLKLKLMEEGAQVPVPKRRSSKLISRGKKIFMNYSSASRSDEFLIRLSSLRLSFVPDC